MANNNGHDARKRHKEQIAKANMSSYSTRTLNNISAWM